MDAPVLRDRTTQVLTLHIILPTVSGIFVLLRLYSRVRHLQGKLGLDDVFATFGWTLSMALDVMICVETRYDLGRDLSVITAENPDNLTTFLKYMYASTFMYITTSLCLKTGILLFYLRISPVPMFRSICFTLIAINVCIWIGCFGSGAFGCTPIRMYWDNTAVGHCIELNKLYLANAIMNMTMDILTLCVPIPTIWMSPSMSTNKKLRITLLFGLGAFVCIASIMRIPTMFGPNVDANVTQNSVDSNRWTMIEVHMASIAAAIPAINALFGPAVQFVSSLDRLSVGVGSSANSTEGSNQRNKQRSLSGREKKKGPRNGESILLETVDDNAKDPENPTTNWKGAEVEVAESERRSRSVASNEHPMPEPQLGGWEGAGKAEAYSPPGYR